MKTLFKTTIVVLAVVLMLVVFTSCNIIPQTPTTTTTTTTPACEHTGGTATCTDLAICEKCGESYGETLPHTTVV